MFNVLEGSAAPDTIATVFTKLGEIMNGFVSSGISFVTTLISNPIGCIVVLLPIGLKAGNWMLKKFKGR